MEILGKNNPNIISANDLLNNLISVSNEMRSQNRSEKSAFNKILKDSELKPDARFNAVKIGDMQYQVKFDRNKNTEINTSIQTQDNGNQTQNESKEEHAVLASLQFNLTPLNTKGFLARLKPVIQSFIHETLQVMKSQSLLKNDQQYTFVFQKVPMEIQINTSKDRIQIVIFFQSDSAVFEEAKVAKSELVNSLNELFPDQEVEVDFIKSYKEKNQEDTSKERDQQESEEQDDDEKKFDV
tara:strand:- start:389 stop:1108 length:720 start_codon:yes stop_codon:yes gene_type:complete